MVVRKSILLYGGEIGISRTGIYTKSHLYKNPKTGTEVYLIGMLHIGELSYYKEVHDILGNCEQVIHENLPVHEWGVNGAIEIILPEQDDGIELFMSAMQAYFARMETSRVSFIKKEAKFFHECIELENWTCGDIVIKPGSEEILEEDVNGRRIQNGLRKSLTDEQLYNRAIDIAMLIKKLKNRTFTKRDFGIGMLLIYAGHEATPFYVNKEIVKRDMHCFEVFDQVMDEKNPKKVGIKFGAGHIPLQRKLLEKRGYKHMISKKVFCIRF